MGDGATKDVERLLQEGLDHYGLDNVEDAIRCWKEVLSLDPENSSAREYLGSVQGEEESGPAAEPPDLAEADESAPFGSLVQDALGLMQDGQLEAALELFETVGRWAPQRMDVQGYLDMARSRLLKQYRDRVGNMDSRPRLRIAPQEIMKFNLPAEAGFLLSLVDDQTTINELVSLAGMDTYEALRVLSGLMDAGILAVEA